ncbi:hypothetical protein FSU_2337 [Fibrobacter succinogenes subsp. succinogenes S85]|uniref:Uncharacterized protein n=1 Tax=Fibrobacter succinogenes (strain ATCC 19169 / S85) TaxID=59374 RepID=D9S4L5_FIBSS|nr:hypothetical protein FSU_2337 [Fibrobacter succinogenes subsp. succinogenes S85]
MTVKLKKKKIVRHWRTKNLKFRKVLAAMNC